MQAIFSRPESTAPFPRKLRDGARELATWQGPDGVLAEPMQVHLRSLRSKDALRVVFCNTTGKPVTIIWMDFCGGEVGYGVVPPGQNFQVQTFKTHPWIARSGVNGEGHRLMVEGHMAAFPEKEDQRFRITHTPPLPWSPQAHRHFPEEFRSSMATLLLEHRARSTRGDQRAERPPTPQPSSTSLAHWLRAIFEPRACTSPELSALLDVLPAELLVHIFALAAPQQRQCTSLHPHGHPDILPVLLPADPACQSKCLRCGTVHEP